MQRRLHSFIESILNILIGYGVMVTAQMLILPYFDVHLSVPDSLEFGGYMTIVSIVRSYLIRRLFTRFIDHRGQNYNMPTTKTTDS